MSSKNTDVFNKDNLDNYLNELSKAYKKLGGKRLPAEIILIGGAAIIENYGFRDMTSDVDAIINAASVMKEAITQVGDKYNLSYGWLNTDVVKTDSYSENLRKYSEHYKTFNQILNVRTVNSEYLIAMKLKSGRKFKNDLSDIIGILAEHKQRNKPITFEKIDSAVSNLYGSWDSIPKDSVSFIKAALDNGDYESIYSEIRKSEKESKKVLIEHQEKYNDQLNEDKANQILDTRKSVLEQLQKLQDEK